VSTIAFETLNVRAEGAVLFAATHSGQVGANTFRFRGRIGGRRLSPGGYRLVARATDAAGNTGAAKRVRFRIVR
jgi:hypothetical protein